MTSPDQPGSASRGPFWSIWLTAFGIIAVLTAAMVRYFSLPVGHPDHGLSAMGEGRATGLVRLGAHSQLDQLLGRSLLTEWQLDAIAVAAAALLAAGYLTAVVRVRRAGPWPFGRTVSFLAGLLVCVLATCSSIGVYDMALFTAHMLGHLAFVMVAPALLMAGRPVELALRSAGPRRRARLERVLASRPVTLLTAPPVALASYAAVIVGSHLTGLMDLIMRNSWAGQVEHLVYLVIGCQFFLLVLGDAPIRWQLSTPGRWFLVALSMAVDTFVGVILMQGSGPIYMTPVPGLQVNALSDTHTGGAIMWFGGDAIMAAIMIGLVLGWLGDPERRRRDNSGWLEQARRATFAERTGSPGQQLAADLDFDAEDDRLAAYNRWLAALDAHPEPAPRGRRR
jgi:cytochrome c oxidase assembly factor CtaG